MQQQKTKEVRFANIEPSGVSDLVLVGYPVVYGEPTEIRMEGGGSYWEVIAPGALDNCDISDSHLTVNHDDQRVPLARTPKTMQLQVTDKGLYMRAVLSRESQAAREVYEAVRRGDLTGMSFCFTVAPEGAAYDSERNLRTITDIQRIYECSIVNRSAYASATVEARDAIRAGHDEARHSAAARAERIVARCRAARLAGNHH